VSIGSGWDTDIAFADSSVILDGPASSSPTFQDFTTITASSLTAFNCSDCIDFDDLEDTLDLDASLTVNQTTSTWTQSFTGDTTVGLTYNANSLTTGTAIAIASTATSFNGELLTLSKTGASGSTAFTSDIANITYSQTFDAAPGDSTGNVLDISRAITVDDGTAGAISGTVSGAVVTITDNCTQGAGDTCTHTGGLLSLTQSFASSTGTVLALSNAGTGMTISVTDDDLIGLGTAAGRIEFDDLATDEVNILNANVGIGTSTPGRQLEVIGAYRASFWEDNDNLAFFIDPSAAASIDVAGTINMGAPSTANTAGLCWDNAGASLIYDCNGAPTDLAEYFGTEDVSIEPGDLVTTTGKAEEKIVVDVLGKETITSKAWIAKSAKPYEKGIIGVVSTSPNLVFGDDGVFDEKDNPRPVSLAGRVPVKVSMENGPIGAGDWITSSSTPGVGMRATEPGMVIGMALESYNKKEVGKILVLVNPHWSPGLVYIAMDGNISSASLAISQPKADPPLAENTTSSLGASSSAQTSNSELLTSNFLLQDDPLFKDLTDKVALLATRINEMSVSASTSALLQEIGEIGQIGKAIDIETATVSGTLAVLGRTTVADLGVTGNISAGLLYINGLDTSLAESNAKATINSVGDLYLQNNQLGGINILAGKIVIDTKGNMVVEGKIAAQSIEAEEFKVLGAKTIGASTLLPGEKSIEVATPAANNNSKIFITPTTVTNKQLAVTYKTDGKFKVEILEADTTPISFDWWIVN